MRAIGGAAVVNRLAHFYLEKRGARVTAASRQIARKRYSYSVGRGGSAVRRRQNSIRTSPLGTLQQDRM